MIGCLAWGVVAVAITSLAVNIFLTRRLVRAEIQAEFRAFRASMRGGRDAP